MNAGIIEVSAVALTENSEKVSQLSERVAVLTADQQHLVKAVQELVATVREQGVASGVYREKMEGKIEAVEKAMAALTADLARVAERGIANWMRKNAPVIGVTVTVSLALATLITWLVQHYK